MALFDEIQNKAIFFVFFNLILAKKYGNKDSFDLNFY